MIPSSLAAPRAQWLCNMLHSDLFSVSGSGGKTKALKFRSEGAQTEPWMDADGTNLTFHLCKTLWEVYGDLLFLEQKDIYLQMQGNKFQVHLVLENGRFIADFNPLDFPLNLPHATLSWTHTHAHAHTHTHTHTQFYSDVSLVCKIFKVLLMVKKMQTTTMYKSIMVHSKI